MTRFTAHAYYVRLSYSFKALRPCSGGGDLSSCGAISRVARSPNAGAAALSGCAVTRASARAEGRRNAPAMPPPLRRSIFNPWSALLHDANERYPAGGARCSDRDETWDASHSSREHPSHAYGVARLTFPRLGGIQARVMHRSGAA
ncbi:uncharacterized protein TRAVEDRAFT_29929 [Trametes versicolor FP-101664 SS1]|uniref:uncharacterized protein n=1 Tax=Trametes versicolor (strain FP-101664) TaxID=717944 RepID=UPI0004623AD2|nr:uncharacterized protein TRAVEDRAFT_29929 [Trametes versicolor FP-101664 SS1]EIW56321.1 hypothetical protein TRAVEDRAFT_29929 [Trametes versicolor FP-101664 SS1]